MSKDKFKKRKLQRRKIRWAMEDLGIKGKDIAARLGISEAAVSQGCATSPRIVAALVEAGVPARLFGKAAPAPQPGAAGGTPALRGEGAKEKEEAACGG
jgi:hypothetical protein